MRRVATDASGWLELCHRALGVPDGLPDAARRRLAERTLLERTGQAVDVLGMGAASAAIDLVIRYGDAGELDEVILRWELAENMAPEVTGLGDEGTRRATLCAKRLLRDVVALIEGPSAGGGDGVPPPSG